MLAMALFAPLLAPYSPIDQTLRDKLLPPFWVEGGSMHYPLGTDAFGRDVFSRLLYGARVDLKVGVLAVISPFVIGSLLGLIAGWFGGWVDAVISRITDAMLAIPFLILAIALAAFLGPSLQNAMIAIGLTATPIFVRLTRGQVMAVKVEDYVEAARAVGNPHWRIALRHVLPNIVPPLLVQASLAIAGAIIAEAALSFLGLGVLPPDISWGQMINDGRPFLLVAWWLIPIPGLTIMMVALAGNLFGDWVRDRLDPHLQRAER